MEIDSISLMLFEANEIGSRVNGENTNPCSLCNNHDPGIHFHGSDLNKCARKLYLNKVNGQPEQFFVSLQYLVDGHLHESAILKNIESGLPNGWKIKIFKNDTEQIDDVGPFKLVTHYDAMLIGNDGNSYILECKAVKPKYFKKFEETRKVRDEWYGQIQSYMLVSKTDVGFFLIKNRENSDLLMPIKVEKDMKFITKRLNKLSEVVGRIETGIRPEKEHDNKKDFECQFCPYIKECYGA